MVPDELLIRCIAAVEAGENPKEVAARYPEHAAALESLLQAVVALRGIPKARMSSSGFGAGRRALAAEAARLQQLRAQQEMQHSAPAQPSTTPPIEQFPAPQDDVETAAR